MAVLKAAPAMTVGVMSGSPGSDVHTLPWKPATCVHCHCQGPATCAPCQQARTWVNMDLLPSAVCPWEKVECVAQPHAQDGMHLGEGRLKQKLCWAGQPAWSRAGSPWLWERQEISALVFVPGTISHQTHRKPGLSALELSWDSQTGQRGWWHARRLLHAAECVNIHASACRVYSSRDCFMAIIPEKEFGATERYAR